MKQKIKNGYIKILAKGRWRFEHRFVTEEFIGKKLTKNEVVHHIDFNKQNNKIENLMVFKNNKAHIKFHTKIKQFGMTNPVRRQIENRWEDLKLN